ncbi:hypothetical protein TrRE_jg12381, partial [Triparma retinervis]
MGWFGNKKSVVSSAAPIDDGHIVSLFKKYDRDGNGTIESSELKQALAEMKLPAYHADEVFDTIDTNHDGKIDLREFTNYVTAKELVLRSTFDKFDVSKTGRISCDDMLHVLDDMHLHPTSADIEKLVEIFDDDH